MMSTAAIDLRLPLVKYSHAESETVRSSVQWTHYSAAHLCLLVRGAAVANGELSLHVVDRNTVMESMDIAHYADRGSDVRRSARQAGSNLSTEQLPIFGIVQEPNVALRLQLQTGRIRRIQLGLLSETHCRRLVETLSHRGVEFQERRPTTGVPKTAPTINAMPVAKTYGRAAPQQSSVDVHHTRPTPSPFHPPSVRIGSLGQFPQQTTLQHGEARLADLRSVRPPSAKHYGNAESTLPPRPCSVTAPRSLALSRDNTHEGKSPERVVESSSSVASRREVSSLRLGAGPSSCPTSAPLVRGNGQSSPGTSHEMTHVATQSSSRPSSALDLPPLQMPRLVEAQSESAAKTTPSNTPSRPSTGCSRLYSAQTAANGAALVTPQPQSTGDLPDIQSRSHLPFANRNSQLTPHEEKCSDVDASKRVARLSSLVDAPHEVETPMQVSSLSQQAKQPGDHRIGPSRSQHVSLAAYEKQSLQAREVALDQFLMDLLSDPSFETLCADVENCWRRSILGL
ncbi:hypothetical protein CERZMDRAFT_100578 [Cercospora zeae-maydis SCOH1-5]|uniref:Uncharacterized protein n=1 Tax=Cercospora zeae-maydis SCOH1-5 TaxID=717836 RepID=A0A6A6F6G0_9PEZI|nr:hypothetical protein CERZMDRAFT_100578 [Cercospora zeae-maydis SCOH1-5]